MKNSESLVCDELAASDDKLTRAREQSGTNPPPIGGIQKAFDFVMISSL